jgi:hypothetical protein
MLQVITMVLIIAALSWIIASWSKGGNKDGGCGPT